MTIEVDYELTIELDYKKEVSGRCPGCKVRFIWAKGKPRLKDAYCPRCGGKLWATTHLFKSGPTVRETPVRGPVVLRCRHCSYVMPPHRFREDREADAAYHLRWDHPEKAHWPRLGGFRVVNTEEHLKEAEHAVQR